MPTIVDLGKRTKSKFPQYNDLPDKEVGRRVKAKFPDAYKDFTDVSQKDTRQAQKPKGLLQQRLAERREQFQRGIERESRGLQTTVETGVQLLGGAAGLVGDVAIGGIGKAVSAITPDIIEKPIRRLGRRFAREIAEQPQLQETLQSLEEIKKTHPRAAANIESVLNVAGIIPTAKGAQVAARGVTRLGGMAVRTGRQVLARGAKKSKAFETALEATQPVFAKKKAIQAFERTGRPGGVVERGRLRGRIGVEPTPRAIEIAEDVTGIVKSKNPVKNLNSLNLEIGKESTRVEKFLRRNNKIFNRQTLNARLKAIEMPDIIRADTTLENTYNLVRQRMMEVVNRSPKNMEGLWKARIEFDDVIDKQFGTGAFSPEKSSAIKRAYLDMRKGVNDFISESTPNNIFKERMRRLSNFYEARFNISENNWRLLNSTRFKRWAKKHPKLAKALLYGGVGFAATKTIERTLGINIPVF